MEEKEISARIKELEEKEDAIEEQVRRFQREEEIEEIELFRASSSLERMRERCSEKDIKIIRLLDEQQQLLHTMQREKSDFADEFFSHIQNEKIKALEEKEDLRYQLHQLQKDTKEGKS